MSESLNYLFTTTKDACFDHVFSEIYSKTLASQRYVIQCARGSTAR